MGGIMLPLLLHDAAPIGEFIRRIHHEDTAIIEKLAFGVE